MNKLWVRLSLGFLLVVVAGMGVMAWAAGRATEASFRGYLMRQNAASAGHDLIARLQDHYAETGSWDGAEALLPARGQGQGQGRGARFLLSDEDGQVVAATDPADLGRMLTRAERTARAIPLTVDRRTVGYLLQDTPGATMLDTAATQFLGEINRWLLVAGLGSALVALLLGVGLAWQITRPLRALTAAARQMAHGELHQHVGVAGTQETTDLAVAFNHLASALARAEAQRQRMSADIAHELRNPVSVMRGQLEAMLDGVQSTDPEHIAVVYDQCLHLARLIDDLRTLTQAEAGRLPLTKSTHTPAALLERVRASFAPLAADASLTLRVEVRPDLPSVWVDPDRIQQVFANLLSNGLRHTPPGGEIGVAAEASAGMVRFSVSNTGSGLTPEQVEHVFDRFWRADEARERDKGGAGLGLTIARGLVMLHGGRIWVEAAPDRTTFNFELPTTPD